MLVTPLIFTVRQPHTCTVLDDASLKCWGKNDSGQLGLGDNSTSGDGSGEMGDNLPVISLWNLSEVLHVENHILICKLPG